MFLQKLVLENVRSIEQIEIPFTDPAGATRKWTFLLGENGTGKSTVLRALALLLAGTDALPELIENPDSWIRAGKEHCVFRAELVTANGEKRQVELRLHRGDKLRDIFARNTESLSQLDSALDHAPRSYLTLGYGVSRRLSDDSSLTATTTKTGGFYQLRAQNVATLFSPDAVLSPLESWAIDLHYRRGERGLTLIKEALANLLPNVDFEAIDREARQLMFRTPDGPLPLGALSDGYQNVAAWCGDMLYRITEIFADYQDPFNARGLLLIDEVDLHLHPVWKRQLVTYLTEKLPRFQIIATTHSALTVHQAGEGELMVLRRETPTSSPTLYHYMEAPRNLTIQQLLVSPIFGLSTADSLPVEQMREEYRRLQAKSPSRLSAADKRRMTKLQAELADLPDPTAQTEREREQAALLKDLQQALQTIAPESARHPTPKTARTPSTEKA